MTLPAPAGVDEACPATVRGAERPRQAAVIARPQDQVNMVGHQAMGPNLDTELLRLLREEIAVDVLIAVLEEHRLAPIAARCHMMRQTGSNDARETGHP